MAEYIDRGALIEDIDAAMDHGGMGYIVGQTLKRYVKRQPAADVALVRHGRWSKFYKSGNRVEEGFVSSCCDMWNERRSPFCHNCGAKMDGDG